MATNISRGHIVISMDGRHAHNVMNALKKQAESTASAIKGMEESGEAETKVQEYRALVSELKSLERAIRENEKMIVDLDGVIQNLATTSRKELKAALKSAMREMEDTSAASGNLDDLREKYRQIDAQLRKIGVEYVNLEKVIQNIDTVSDKTLRKAAEQLREERDATERGTEAYARRSAMLREVEAALKSRSGMPVSQAMSVADGSTEATVAQTRQAIAALKEYRETLSTSDTSGIRKVDAALSQLNDRLNATEKETMDVAAILSDPASFSPEQIRRAIAQVNAELDRMKMNDVGRGELRSQVTRLNAALRETEKEVVDVDYVMNNLKTAPIDMLKRAAKQLSEQINNAERNSEAYIRASARYSQIRAEIEGINKSWSTQDGTIMKVFKRLTAYVGIYGAFNLIKNKLTEVVDKNLKFSDTLSDIRKTTGLSAEAVNDLSDAINKIDTRTKVEDMHRMAFEAGRLGMGKYGAEGILGFVRASNQLSVALKEDLGQDAITELAKISDVMGLVKKMGVEKSLLSIGSAINTLSQTSTAKGEYIANYTGRLAGIASQAGIATDELLGFAAASDATKQEVEVAATAMGKFVTRLSTHTGVVARVTGVNKEMLQSMLQQGKMADAVILVLEKLNEKGGLSALAPIMKDLGSDGARLTASLANLAQNVDMVKSAVATSRKSFKEAKSVIEEYNIKNENAAAIMERMKNSWEKMFVNSGNVGALKELVIELSDLSKKLQSNTMLIAQVKLLVASFILAFKTFVALAPAVFAFLGSKLWVSFAYVLKGQLVPAFKAASLGLRTFVGAFRGANVAVMTFKNTWNNMDKSMKKNIFGVILSLLAMVISYFMSLNDAIEDTHEEMSLLDRSFKDYNKELLTARERSNGLFNQLKNENLTKEEKVLLLSEINRLYGEYLPALLNEKSSLKEIEEAQKEVNKQLQQSIAYKIKNAAIDELGSERLDSLAQKLNKFDTKFVNSKGGRDKLWALSEELYALGASRDEVYNRLFQEFNSDIHRLRKTGELANYNQVGLVRQKREQHKMLINNMTDYVMEYFAFQDEIKDIERKFDPLIGDYKPKQGKGGVFGETEEENKRKEMLRIYRGQYEAVIAAIEVYYKQQEQAVRQSYLDQKITMEQMEQQLDAVAFRHLQTRIDARKKLHGDADENWASNLLGLSNEDLARTERSMNAIKNLAGKNLDEIGRMLRRFGEKEDDQIWAKLEEDLLAMQGIMIDRRKEIEKILMEYDFTGKVTRKYQTELEKLRLFFVNYTDEVKNGYANADEAAAAGMKRLRSLGGRLFDIDIHSGEGLNAFKGMLMEAEEFGAQMLNMADEDYRVLYYKVLEYADAMTEAEKKIRERQLKIASERYSRTDAYKKNEGREASNRSLTDIYQAAGQLGLASDSMVQDREVQMYQARLEAAMDYYEYLRTQGFSTEEQYLKVQEAAAELSSKLVEQVRLKLENLKNYTEGFERFGEEFGAAVISPISERQKALENMVRSFGEATKKIILDWVKQKIEHEILRHTMVENEEKYREAMTDAEKGVEKNKERAEKTMARAAMKRARGFLKDQLTIKKKGAQEEEQVEEEKQSVQELIATEGSEAIGKAVIDIGGKVTEAKKEQASEQVQTQAAQTSVETTMGIASGASKTIGQLGWWGIPLVAVITALLNGLLAAGMSKLSSLFGGGAAAGGASAKTKLVTGMLTYDAGNVQRFSGVIDGRSYPYLGSDGKVYQATQASELKTGLVANPIATLVDGKPSLIAERGPEIIIGRETTAAMMMSRPDLLSEIVRFDRNRSGKSYRAYDDGNVQQKIGPLAATDAQGGAPALDRSVGAAILAALEDVATVNAALYERIRKGIPAVIEKNGRGGLIDEVIDGLNFAKKNNTSEKLRSLLGGK